MQHAHADAHFCEQKTDSALAVTTPSTQGSCTAAAFWQLQQKRRPSTPIGCSSCLCTSRRQTVIASAIGRHSWPGCSLRRMLLHRKVASRVDYLWLQLHCDHGKRSLGTCDGM
jgi:hypothetical protein